jgi:hypothetical protein
MTYFKSILILMLAPTLLQLLETVSGREKDFRDINELMFSHSFSLSLCFGTPNGQKLQPVWQLFIISNTQMQNPD